MEPTGEFFLLHWPSSTWLLLGEGQPSKRLPPQSRDSASQHCRHLGLQRQGAAPVATSTGWVGQKATQNKSHPQYLGMKSSVEGHIEINFNLKIKRRNSQRAMQETLLTTLLLLLLLLFERCRERHRQGAILSLLVYSLRKCPEQLWLGQAKSQEPDPIQDPHMGHRDPAPHLLLLSY